jgi:hypothetical protein
VTRLLIALVMASAVLCSSAAAQEKEAAAKRVVPDAFAAVPLRAQVVIARYDGEKRISSLPYTLSFNGTHGNNAQVRMGAEIPISTSGGSDQKASTSVNYQHVGTQIDASINPSNDGRYVLRLAISEKSIYGDGQGPAVAKGTLPSFRSYASTNTVVLKVGETSQFTAAADRLTGEVVRVEVTLQAAGAK